MRQTVLQARRWSVALLVFCGVAGNASRVLAQPSASDKPTLEVYGFFMADAIADFNQVNPDWYDSARPSKLPNVANQFGEDGRFSISPRQTRFGVRSTLPTSNGEIKGQFEFDMYGTGKDAGLATIRLRHAWGQWKSFGGGYTNSAFMDGDVFPNTVEYWGPNGMLFLRNSQIFFEPFNDGKSNARIAIEAPGASGDLGVLSERVELQNVRARFPRPDITGHYRRGMDWGYVQVGGAIRYFAYDDLITTDQFALSGSNWGWGISLSSNIKASPRDVVRLQLIDGAGVENYFNDAPVDLGIQSNPGNPVTPVVGKPLGDFGLVAYLDHTWNDKFTSAFGYTRVDISNSDGQSPNAYKNGEYLSGNLLCTPAPNFLLGGEFVWIHRNNFSDGFAVSDFRLQFSVKVNFSVKVGG